MNVKRLFLVCILSTVALFLGILLYALMCPPLPFDGAAHQTEELRVQSHTWATNCTSITLTVRNLGTVSLSVEKVLVNDVVASNVTYCPASSGTASMLLPGEPGTITITQQFSSGIKYVFDIISARGHLYDYVTTAP